MATTLPSAAVPPTRPVLVWNPEADETHTEPTVEQAARFLGATAADVLAAISAGELLRGWFVDWEAPRPAPR